LIATIVAEANGSRAEVRMWGVFVRVLMPIGRSVGCAKCHAISRGANCKRQKLTHPAVFYPHVADV
jgi:hypothetical protein